jgi:hypothetical protein
VECHFRIRLSSLASDDTIRREYAERIAQYSSFLAARRSRIPKALWRYFSEDFFHDGRMSRVQFDPSLRNAQLTIDCPNVKYTKSPDDVRFVSVSFEARLRNVYAFMLTQTSEPSRSPVSPAFLGSEIDTCEQAIEEATRLIGEEHHSLIIETDVNCLTIVFQHISVEGTERTATELLMHDYRYKFPDERLS